MVNAQMLRAGWVKFISYSHYKKFKHEDFLKSAEASARSQKLNLWRP